MFGCLKLLRHDLRWMNTIQFVLYHFDLFLRIESQLFFSFFVIHVGCYGRRLIIPLSLHFFGLFDPVKERFFDEDLAGVQDQVLALAQGAHCVNHGLFVGTFERVRCNDSFYLLREPEWHQLRHSQLHSTAERNAEINAKHLTVCCVN